MKPKQNKRNTNRYRLGVGDWLKCWNSHMYAIDFGYLHSMALAGMIVTCSKKRKDKRIDTTFFFKIFTLI